MKRYIKQRDSYGCGPVSIYNSLIWSNQKLPNLKSLYKKVKTTKDGSNQVDVTKVLKSYKRFKVKKFIQPKKSILNIKSDTIALVLYCWKVGKVYGGHFTLIEKTTKYMYYIVNNYIEGKALKKIYRKTFDKDFKRKINPETKLIYPIVWLITRK